MFSQLRYNTRILVFNLLLEYKDPYAEDKQFEHDPTEKIFY